MAKIFKPLFIFNLVIVLFVFCSTPTMAENAVPVENPSAIKLGLTYFYFDYKEDLVMPAKSTEYGWLPGVFLDYTFKKKSSIYAKIFLSYAAADITYDGASQPSGTPLKFTNESARMFKFEANIGYAIPLAKNFLLIPYLGYGYQYWWRGDPNYLAEFNTFTYEEDYRWHYIPVGIKADYNITEKLNMAASVTANFMVYGTATAYFSKIPFGYPDMGFTLGNRIGFYAEIPVTYKFTNDIGISVTPWYEYRSFGASDVNIYGFYEPSSTANEYGVNVGVLLSF
ncbi:MAG: outer membrane beta-barrel protein [Smithellaceae bacterium]